ncbi:MAG: NUDIX domain-containing protein [bacterium]
MWIPEEVFKTILKSVPRVTVDLIIVRPSGKGFALEFLLAKRKQRPSVGQWFIPGGSILKGERIQKAVRRQLKREMGLTAEKILFVGAMDFFGVNDMNIRYHSVMLLHMVYVEADSKTNPNRENGSVKWFSKINPHWRKTVREALAMAGFTQ